MNGSFSLLRANTALTTNCKLVVDTQYNLYLESYSANRELSDKQFKKFQITADSFLSQRIASFYKGLPTDLAFDVKNDIHSDTIQNDYNNQFDDIYYSGARNVEDTRYLEEFQYNTTLKINPAKLPKYFMIFRVDGPGTKEVINVNDTAPTTPYEYVNDYITNTKLITVFDLTPKTNLGKLWKKNYIDDDLLLRSPVELNFKQFEFSKWNGYDYYSGGTVSKSFIMNDYMQNQTTPFDLENFITEGFRKNAVISSHYSNISFLYDDTVSGVFYKSETVDQFKYYEKTYPFITKYIQEGTILSSQYIKVVEPSTSLVYYTFTENVPYRRKWTINRYTGFYIDDILETNKISPYTTVEFKLGAGIYLVNNVFRESNSPSALSVNPVKGTYDVNLPIYLKIGKELFLVELNNNDYVLISNTIFNGLIDTFINSAQKAITIVYEDDGTGIFRSYLKHIDNSYFVDNNIFLNQNSIFVIKIVDKYYSLKIDANQHIYLGTDEYVLCDVNKIYRKLGFNTAVVDNIQVLTKDNNITYFEIYQLQFTKIGDWDFIRENTNYAGIEYNKTNNVSYKRSFLYGLNIQDISVPIDPYNEKYYNIWLTNGITPVLKFTNTFILPLASEYAASGDLYMLSNLNNLTKIWDINQSIAKWGIYQSINNMSHPYSINNSLDVCGQHNFTPNLYSSYVDLQNMTLDWFYTLGKPSTQDFNKPVRIVDFLANPVLNINERSLNIDLPGYGPDPDNYNNYIKFDIDYYKNNKATFDYFDYIFNLPVIIPFNASNNIKHYNRISYFTETDNVNGPAVFFKGLSAYIQYVDTDNPNSNEKFVTTPANDLAGYGFSILYSPRFTDSQALVGKAGIEIILNKIYKNVLINIYVYTLSGTYTSLDYRERDLVYDETNVIFINWDDAILQTAYIWQDSELPTQSLTLKTLIDILTENKLTHPSYSQDIKYIVVDNNEEFNISSVSCVYDIGTNKSLVTFNFDKEIPLQHGEWIFLQNTGYVQFNTNLQILRKNNNRSIVVELTDDQTIPVSLMIASTIICTKEQSVYPFRLKVILPDEIKVNKNFNYMIGDTSCPVKPRNTFTLNTDILVSSLDYINNIPHVYVDDNISRRIQKLNTNKELSYSEIDQLPAIFRYSGDYEPIIQDIDIFNTPTLSIYNDTIIASPVRYIEFELIDGIYYISVHMTNVSNINVNDVFYINEINNILTTAPWLEFKNKVEYKTGHVTAVELSTIVPGAYRITLSLELINNPVFPVMFIDLTASGYTMDLYLYKHKISNTSFYYDYTYFGQQKELIIAKTYDTINPLQTSNDIWKTTNKFPMIDEHGVTTITRNLFKSSWDPKFYYKSASNKYINKV